MKKFLRTVWNITKDIPVVVFFVTFFACLGIAAAIAYLYFYVAPSVNTLSQENIRQTTNIYDRTGQHVLYELYGEENRKIVSHDEISDYMRVATIAAEDDAFYSHFGIDPKSIVRAMKVNYESESVQQGGSTITMQLAKNVFLTKERTLERKIAEAILSLKLERHFTKDEILDWYLNVVPYGSNAYGVQTASQVFFGKNASELSLDEAALLAAFPKATTFYSPHGSHREDLVERQKTILHRINELGLVDSAHIEEALQVDILSKVQEYKQDIQAPHFVMHVLEQLEKEYGRALLEIGGFEIRTTLDMELQQLAETSVREGVERNAQYNALNAALVAIDPKTGEVLAMVGSKDYFDSSIDGQVNVSTRPRQPGSAFKPFAYARAFELGFQPESVFFDVRTNFGPDGSGKDYIPQNYDGQFRGLVSMRQALAMSLNVPAVKALYLAGVQQTIDLAHRLGITTLNDRDRYGLSLVLGGGEITLLDGTSAFSVFANDGMRNSSTAILEIRTSTGGVFDEKPKIQQQVLDQNIARKINSILSDNTARTPVFGGRSPLYIPGRTVAAKTGTTQEYRDGWTMGYTPSLAAGVWAGNNDNTAMRPGAAGVFVAAPIWNSFMKEALSRYPNESFVAYEKDSVPTPMVSGEFNKKITYYNTKTGKEISEKKARKTSAKKVQQRIEPEQHSILYYVHEQASQSSDFPQYNEDMFTRWEEAVRGEDPALFVTQ